MSLCGRGYGRALCALSLSKNLFGDVEDAVPYKSTYIEYI
jgi:hypothetical protein